MEPVNLSLVNISKSFGSRLVLDNFNLEIQPGSITCLFGPSGCGKTTLLNIIGGLIDPDSGFRKGFPEKSFSYIFQEIRILPWKTILGNVIFPLLDHMSYKQARSHAIRFIEMVGLEHEETFYPGQLSGGMKQRISIARAFAYPSEIILMDEAFQNLDNTLKYNILNSFLEIWAKDRRTVIFVTHDIEEAVFLGQQIILLDKNPMRVISLINANETEPSLLKEMMRNPSGLTD